MMVADEGGFVEADYQQPKPYPTPKQIEPQEERRMKPKSSRGLLPKRWPIKVLVRIPRKNGEEWFFDKARRQKDRDTGEEYFRMKSMKQNAKPSAFKNMVASNRGLFVEVFSPSPSEFYPCNFDGSAVSAMNEDQKQFYASEVNRAHMRWQKKGFWEKYGTIVLPIALIGIFAFSLIMIMYGINQYVTPQLNSLGNQLVQIAEALGRGAVAVKGIAPVA